MSKIDDDVTEIFAYVLGWQPSHPDPAVDSVKPKVKTAYKQFHSVLVWRALLDNAKYSDKIRLYINETASDISHAFFLNIISLYKSSRSSLRSGIENYVRVILLAQGQHIESLTSVFDLFAHARKNLASDQTALGIFDKLREAYAELCKSVHSAKVDYLAKTVPFEKLSLYEQTQFFSNIEKLREVCALINQLSFWQWSEYLANIDYQNSDFIKDSLPRKLKRMKYE